MYKFKIPLFIAVNTLRLTSLGAFAFGVLIIIFHFENPDRLYELPGNLIPILAAFLLGSLLIYTSNFLVKLEKWSWITTFVIGIINVIFAILIFITFPFSIANVYFSVGSLNLLSVVVPFYRKHYLNKLSSHKAKKEISIAISILTIILFTVLSFFLFVSLGLAMIED